MSEPSRILIVGGGIAGLAVAAALRQRGLSANLVERSPRWTPAGAAIVLHGNALRMLGALGLEGTVRAASAPIACWRFRDSHGEPLCVTDLDQLWGRPGQCRGISRGALHQILRDATHGIPPRAGVAATGLVQHGTHVSVSFSDGSHARYRLVIGADGIRSTVRRLAVSSAEPRYAGLMAWRGIAPMRPGATELAIFLGEDRFFGLAPAGNGLVYGFAGVQAERCDEPLPGRLHRLRDRFASFARPVRDYLDALSGDADVHAGPVESIGIPRWHHRRVVLIEDAAHAATPHMGQGGAMALEDAVILPEFLATTSDIDMALDAYAARRWDRVAWVREQSRRAAIAWMLPAADRNLALRRHGDRQLRDRYRPLIPPP